MDRIADIVQDLGEQYIQYLWFREIFNAGITLALLVMLGSVFYHAFKWLMEK